MCTYTLNADLEPHIKKKGGATNVRAVCCVTRNVFSRMKKGDAVNYKTAKAICDGFGLDSDKTFCIHEKVVEYAPATLKKTYNMISRIFKSAVYDGLIGENPCNRVEPPKVPRSEAKAFSEEEVLARHP